MSTQLISNKATVALSTNAIGPKTVFSNSHFNSNISDTNQSGYLSRKEVAKLLKITLPTLHDWTKLQYLRAYKIGTRVLYKESEVIETLEKVPSFKHRKGGLNV
jgi:excisionase family DNA binding protein